jgi:hypothetical protein
MNRGWSEDVVLGGVMGGLALCCLMSGALWIWCRCCCVDSHGAIRPLIILILTTIVITGKPSAEPSFKPCPSWEFGHLCLSLESEVDDSPHLVHNDSPIGQESTEGQHTTALPCGHVLCSDECYPTFISQFDECLICRASVVTGQT